MSTTTKGRTTKNVGGGRKGRIESSPVKSATTTKRPVERLRGAKQKVTTISDTLNIARTSEGKPKLPNGNGGVRFDGEVIKGIYVPQRAWADAGKPESFEVTLTAK